MGLEDFTTENRNKVGSVSSRKNIENLKMSEKWWENLAYHHPSMLTLLFSDYSKAELKAIIELFDKVIQDDIDGIGVSEERKEEVKEHREDIIEKLKEKN